jgi:hypothetical protein
VACIALSFGVAPAWAADEEAPAPATSATAATSAAPVTPAVPETSAAPVTSVVPVTSAAPAASAAPAKPAKAAVPVRIYERVVFSLVADRAGQTARERAGAAGRALVTAVEDAESQDARIEERDGVAIVYVGKTPIVTLGEEDATASGETLHAFAASVAARAQEAVRAEEKRRSIASTVFSVSLLVFSGLLAFLLSRRVSQFGETARAWVRANPQRIPALRLRHIEVVRPRAVRGGVTIALGLTHLVAQLAIAYAWLLIALSLFDATRGYTERLTGFVLAPLWALVGRLGSALPVVVVAGLAALVVGVLVRFIALFFESVAEGNTTLAWLPTDLAAPTSALARGAVVVAAIVLAAPMLTGTDDGALSRVGVAVLVALGLASTPIVASVAAGLPIVFGRRFLTGELVAIGGSAGRVKSVSLLTVTLEGDDGAELRIPHLLSLVRATRIVRGAAPVSVDLAIAPGEAQARVRERLLALAAGVATRPRVELVHVDGDGARYRVTACPVDGAGDLAATLADGLRAENIALGRIVASPRGA